MRYRDIIPGNCGEQHGNLWLEIDRGYGNLDNEVSFLNTGGYLSFEAWRFIDTHNSTYMSPSDFICFLRHGKPSSSGLANGYFSGNRQHIGGYIGFKIVG